ncbi:MAG: endonuclease/exonuclease/phosphatase family protein [Rhodospirillales bacterium]|nr:endonuclease/exonuclease/phosphatase family protein [Rhodospirillales bacterium]
MAGFRIATFNLENLGKPVASGADLQERIRVLRPQLLRLRADVLCLQEIDGQRPEGGHRRLYALDALLEGTPYQDFGRASTLSRSSGEVRDKHNLVVLSRYPIIGQRQILHDLVAPPSYQPLEAREEAAADPTADAPRMKQSQAIEWDRPILHIILDIGGDRPLHIVAVHLRASRAAFVEGQKADSQTWRSMRGWAEGFFLASMKRAGQALEARLLVDAIFDDDPDALVCVCGDFNADIHQTPVRTIRGDEEDAGNPHLAARTLVPVERSVAQSRRFSVLHHGRPQMLDHLLVSRSLLGWYRSVEIHNEALGDELVTAHAVRGSPESFHAPVVAKFVAT